MIAHIPEHLEQRARNALERDGLLVRNEIKGGGTRTVIMEALVIDRQGHDTAPYPDGYCGECGKACRAVEVDFGHGERRYHGAVDKRLVSECCEVEVCEDEDFTLEIERESEAERQACLREEREDRRRDEELINGQ